MMLRRLVACAVVGLLAAAGLAWPRIDQVETGRSPEYPDLKPRDYTAPAPEVVRAAEAALAELGWSTTGSGRGPLGAEIAAVHKTLPGIDEEVAVKVRREAGRTRVVVRSRSLTLPWDFGQNARNVRAVLAALDRRVR